jgi:hypothetical protein
VSTSPEDVREALANNLSSIKGVGCSPWNLGTNFQTPVLQVAGNGPVIYDRRGTDKLTFVVQAIVGTVDDIGGQRLLSTFVQASGSQSVKAAIESDRTLGGIVDDLRVTGYLGDTSITLPNGVEYLTGQWTVEVLAPE